MALLDLNSWVRFGTGLIAGWWIGAAIGLAIALLLAGRRIKQLETANALLRLKLRAREKPRHTATWSTGPVLIVPPGAGRTESPPRRAASGE